MGQAIFYRLYGVACFHMTLVCDLRRGGVSVRKEIRTDGCPYTTIRYRIASSRSEPIRLHIVETLPPDLGDDDVGLHPGFDPAAWRRSDGHRLAYSRQLDPGERIVTCLFLAESVERDVLDRPPIVQLAPASDAGEDGHESDEAVGASGASGGPQPSVAGVDVDTISIMDEATDERATGETLQLQDPDSRPKSSPGTRSNYRAESPEEPTPDEPLRLHTDGGESTEGTGD